MRFLGGGNPGFAIIEMLIALALLSLLVATVTPGRVIRSKGSILLAEGARLSTALRETRSAAVRRGETLVMSIDADTGQYASPAAKPGKIDSLVTIRMVGAEVLKQQASKGGVAFFPNGQSTGSRITLKIEEQFVEVIVGWATGEVRVSH